MNKIKRNESCSYNCGGYALGTETWYLPYENYDYKNHEIMDKYCQDIEQGYEELLDLNTDSILNDFKGMIRVVEKNEQVKQNEEKIAFRLGSDIYGYDYDFHFRVFRNGCWREKCGSNPPKIIDDDDNDFEEPWVNGDMIYDSRIVYFAMSE